MYELIIAPTTRGLFGDRQGFCPVAATRDMPALLVRRLVALAERQLEELRGANRSLTMCACHLPLVLEQRPYHLVSRAVRSEDRELAEAETSDASGWLFHQILLDSVGGLPGGPAWLLANESIWQSSWDLPPQFFEPRKLTGPIVSPQICEQWQRQTGDAGWAGAAIEAVQKQVAFALVVPPLLQPPVSLEMLAEAQSMLEPQQRWRIPLTVSAWIPPKLGRQRWTVVASGSQDALAAARDPDFVVVDLTRKLGPAASRFAGIARAGDWARLQTPRPTASNSEPATKPAATPQVDETLFTIDCQSTPLTAAAPAHSRQVLYPSFRERVAFPWLKWTGLVGSLLLVGFAIWRGSHVVQNFVAAQPESKTPAGVRPENESSDLNERPRATATSDVMQPTDRRPSAQASGGTSDAADVPSGTDDAAPPAQPSSQPGDGEDPPASATGAVAPGGPQSPPKPVPSAGRGPDRPLLSAAVANGILTQLREQYPHVVLPVDVTEAAAELVALSLSRDMLPEMAFGMATSRQWIPFLPPDERGEAAEEFHASFPEPAANQSVSAAISVVWRGTAEAEIADVRWRWLGKPSAELLNDLQAGAFVVWLRREPSIAAGLPLVAAAESPSQTALTTMRLGWEVALPLEAKLRLPTATDPDDAARLGWKPRVTGLAVEQADAKERDRDSLWIPPFSSENPTGFFVLNDRRFADLYRARFGPQPADQNVSEFERLLGQLQPIQVDLKLEALNPPTPEQPAMRLRLQGLIYMRTPEGSRHSIILQAAPNELKPAKEKEFEARIEHELRTWLAKGLQLPESVTKTFLDGGFAGKKLTRIAKLDRDTEQTSTAFAELLYGELEALLHQQIHMEIDRTTIVQMPEGEEELTVPVWRSN